MVAKHGIHRRQFLQQVVVIGTGLSLSQTEPNLSHGEHDITIGTWPHRIYKENNAPVGAGEDRELCL